MALITIPVSEIAGPRTEKLRSWCTQLEAGDILLFPESPVPISSEDGQFLLQQHLTGSAYHKNIAYRPAEDRVTGFGGPASGSKAKSAEGPGDTEPAGERMRTVMRKYSNAVESFLTRILPFYESRWHKDYASFRPQEEEGRDLSVRKRNDLLHTDAFPTRPTNGDRILRFFNNIHPSRTRNWVTTETFDVLVSKMRNGDSLFFGGGVDGRKSGGHQRHQRGVRIPGSLREPALPRLLRSLGLGSVLPGLCRGPYDEFMLRFHHFLKENEHFQKNCVKQYWQFPPGSSWMVYTDAVSHAVLSGQYALEQTFIVRKDAMIAPQKSPYGVLSTLAHTRLAP